LERGREKIGATILQGNAKNYTPGQHVLYIILDRASHIVRIKFINGDLFTLRYYDDIANFTVNPIGDGEVAIKKYRGGI